jgi:putative ABC transport system substrate-binding protein
MGREMKRKILFLFFIFFILSIGLAEAGYDIAVLRSRNIKPYVLSLEGFVDGLKRLGLTEGVGYNLRLFDMSRDKAQNTAVVKDIKALDPDIILALGFEAAEILKENITDTPVVFAMVHDPVASGLVLRMENSGNNLTGASLNVSSLLQFESIKSIFPKTHSIGVIYDPFKSGTTIEQAKTAAEELGINLVREPVSSHKLVPEATRGLIDRIDVLWLIPDSTVVTRSSLEYIFVKMLWSKKVIVGYDPDVVKAGALFALSPDPFDIGKQAGESAYIVLQGIPPYQIPVTTPRKAFYVFNLKIARKIDVEIPPALLRKAVEVIE